MNGTSKVVFAMTPTPNPDDVVLYATHAINATTGIGMDILVDIIERYVPTSRGKGSSTKKEIVYTRRYECPCCPTSLNALVDVHCEGTASEDWREVEGLYKVSIEPVYDHRNNRCTVIVTKLSACATPVFVGAIDRLPKKDYATARTKGKETEAMANTKRRKPQPV